MSTLVPRIICSERTTNDSQNRSSEQVADGNERNRIWHTYENKRRENKCVLKNKSKNNAVCCSVYETEHTVYLLRKKLQDGGSETCSYSCRRRQDSRPKNPEQLVYQLRYTLFTLLYIVFNFLNSQLCCILIQNTPQSPWTASQGTHL